MVKHKMGHKLTQPGDRRKAIAFWRRCASIWLSQRFAEQAIEGWHPAELKADVVERFRRRVNEFRESAK